VKHPLKYERYVHDFLEYVGEDPSREGLRGTPKRVVDAVQELLRGYTTPMPDLKTFKSTNDQMVVSSGIHCFSMCEHHVLPIWIVADVGYIPNKKVIGISKISRLVKWCCARLVIQEDLTDRIAEILTERLNPLGVIVVLRGRHMCMEMRGVKTNSVITTSAIRGLFKKPLNTGLNPVEEFLHHCRRSVI